MWAASVKHGQASLWEFEGDRAHKRDVSLEDELKYRPTIFSNVRQKDEQSAFIIHK